MPIYEFLCEPCNTIFNFLSRRVNIDAKPSCPKCGKKLQRMMSSFSTIGRAKEPSDDVFSGMDEAGMERVLGDLARESENLHEEDPRQMARMMRRFTEKTGLDLSGPVAEALKRLESGEDMESIEEDLGDLLEGDEMPFELKGRKGKKKAKPHRDETLYEL